VDNKELIYGDTDSTALLMPSNEDSRQLVIDNTLVTKLLENGLDKDHVFVVAHSLEYTSCLNSYLKEFSTANGFTRNLELKLDRYFSDILFKKYYDNETKKYRGAKKKYVGNVLWEKRPVNYLKIVGFEYIRKDASKITKVIQPRVFEYILSGDYTSVKKYIKDTVDRITNTYSVSGINPNEIAIPTTLSKETTKYGKVGKDGDIVGIPEYVRGSIYANKWLGEDIRESDQVHMVFVKSLKSYPPTDVICYTDPNLLPKDLEIDVELQIRRSIKMPLEDVLDSVDISWKDIFTPNRKLW
jgi:DNA polymerase elongation subunit (family B)